MSCVFSNKVSLAIISVVAKLSVLAVTVLLIFELSDLASGKVSSEIFDFESQTVSSYNRLKKKLVLCKTAHQFDIFCRTEVF